MTSILVIIGLAIFSFVVDKIKAEMKKYEQELEKKTVKVGEVVGTKNTNLGKNNKVKKEKRKIVDREKEIYSNFEVVDKDKIVNDIIFAEVLAKPKSKR